MELILNNGFRRVWNKPLWEMDRDFHYNRFNKTFNRFHRWRFGYYDYKNGERFNHKTCLGSDIVNYKYNIRCVK